MFCKTKQVFVTALVLCLFFSQSYAQAKESSTKSAWSDSVYIGAGLGRTQLDEGSQCDVLSCNFKDTSYKLFAGYRFNSYFSAEVGYLDYGTFSLSNRRTGVKIKADSEALFLHSMLSYPVSDRVAVNCKVGVNRKRIDYSTGLSKEKSTDIVLGLGLSFHLNQSIAVRAEWERIAVEDSGDKSAMVMGNLIYSI